MASQFGVIAWKFQGGESLNPEEVEVYPIKKLVIKDASIARPGSSVCLQLKQTLWEGTIISLHGKKRDAEIALESESPLTDAAHCSETSESVRSRKKKTFGEDFLGEDNRGEVSSGEKREVSSGEKRMKGKCNKENKNSDPKELENPGKKASAKSNKEKQKEKERRKEERQQEQNVLKEQNSVLLSRMVSLNEEWDDDQEGDTFDSTVVDDCMEMVNINSSRSQPHTSISKYTPRTTPPIISSCSHDQHPSTPRNTQRPLLPRFPGVEEHTPYPRLPSTNNSPEHLYSRTLDPLQSEVDAVLTRHSTPLTTQERPQFGGKCPRRMHDQECASGDTNGCSSCKRLKREVVHLKRQLSLYQEQNDQTLPKPGKVHPAIADRFKMIELSLGSGVYVFDKHIEQAMARKSATSCVSFLLNCFYTNTEMAGMNLMGANDKPHPDKDIVESMLAFTMKKHSGVMAATLKASLRNKFTANNSRASKNS